MACTNICVSRVLLANAMFGSILNSSPLQEFLFVSFFFLLYVYIVESEKKLCVLGLFSKDLNKSECRLTSSEDES